MVKSSWAEAAAAAAAEEEEDEPEVTPREDERELVGEVTLELLFVVVVVESALFVTPPCRSRV